MHIESTMDWRCCTSISQFIFAIIVFFALSSTSEKAPFITFAKEATQAPEVTYHDYIVVGGGTAACALTATLSQGAKVLVLERGDLPYGIPFVNSVKGFYPSLYNILPNSASQIFVSTDGVINQRGRVLGGGSALNAGFYTRASDDYIKEAGWDPKLVKESYEWVEQKLVHEPKVSAWQAAVRAGLLEAGVLPDNGFTFEHLPGTKTGGSIFDRDGKRHSAADLLEYADPININVYLKAIVHQILFDANGRRAEGVLYKDKIGKMHTAFLNKGSLKNEVIVSAGTLGSPQFLMLSGIGPSQHLAAHGIKVVMDQPMVGQELSDNPMNYVVLPTAGGLETSVVEVVGITPFGSYIEASSTHIDWPWVKKSGAPFGVLANQTMELGKIKSIFASQVDTKGLNAGLVLEKVDGPFSSGILELNNKNPDDNPKVTFNYFKDTRDLEKCIKGMETIVKVLESKAISKFRNPLLSVRDLLGLIVALPLNMRPKHVRAAFDLQQYCIDTVTTIWHYHGGCRVDKVVDRDYKVIGIGALRVIDSSTLLSSPGTNPQATIMMLGRYMGQKILEERSIIGRK